MHVWPGKRRPKLPGNGAFSVGAVATQVAAMDATTQHKDRDKPWSQDLPLGLPEPGPLVQDSVDHGPTPCPG